MTRKHGFDCLFPLPTKLFGFLLRDMQPSRTILDDEMKATPILDDNEDVNGDSARRHHDSWVRRSLEDVTSFIPETAQRSGRLRVRAIDSTMWVEASFYRSS